MSLATYDDLQAAVASRLKRDDLTTLIPDYIRLAEARMLTLIDPHAYEVNTTLVTVPSSDTVALPADFKNPIALWITDINPQQPLDQVLPQSLPYTTTPSRPLYWAIDESNLRFQAPADAAYPLKLRYQQTFALSDSVPTNAVLTKYPDLYLFGVLVEAADDTYDEEREVKWDARFRDAVQRCNNQESSENKFVPLMTELGQAHRQRFNINRGY